MPYLKDSVRSALNQDYENIEVTVVDNAPQNETARWLRQFTDSQVTVKYRAELQSVSENWTQAIEIVSGAYKELLCADDFLDPGIVSTQVQQLDSSPAAVKAASKHRIVGSHGKVVMQTKDFSVSNYVRVNQQLRKSAFSPLQIY